MHFPVTWCFTRDVKAVTQRKLAVVNCKQVLWSDEKWENRRNLKQAMPANVPRLDPRRFIVGSENSTVTSTALKKFLKIVKLQQHRRQQEDAVKTRRKSVVTEEDMMKTASFKKLN